MVNTVHKLIVLGGCYPYSSQGPVVGGAVQEEMEKCPSVQEEME